MNRRNFLAAGVLAGVGFALPQFGSGAVARHSYKLAPFSTLPEDLKRGRAEEIIEAYRFAVVNRPVLQYIPCYCGCGETAGHTSNASCYVKDKSPIDKPEFDSMSVG